jgi:hypothetical protein
MKFTILAITSLVAAAPIVQISDSVTVERRFLGLFKLKHEIIHKVVDKKVGILGHALEHKAQIVKKILSHGHGHKPPKKSKPPKYPEPEYKGHYYQ